MNSLSALVQGWRGLAADLDLLERIGGERYRRHSRLIAWFFDPSLRAAFHVRLIVNGGRILSTLAHARLLHSYGCDVSRGAKFEGAFRLPHPTGVVIGDRVSVGDSVIVYQNVTLGMGSDGGYPRLEHNSIVYANAIVVGAVTVGESARVGAGTFLAHSIPSGATYTGKRD